MKVSLFVSCLVDQLWPAVGVASVRVLRRAGCEVSFNQAQTCCGQPAFNAGHRAQARSVAQHMIRTFEDDPAEAIVMPSGSCVAMVRHAKELFADEGGWLARAEALAARTHELGSFLVDVLGVDDVGASWAGRLSWHDACHGLRDLGIRAQPRQLIAKVRGAELVEARSSESCCGFGGTFSVKFPEVSVAMLDQKLQALEQSEVDAIVSGDVSCLMQIGGRLARRRSGIRTLHLAELLASRA